MCQTYEGNEIAFVPQGAIKRDYVIKNKISNIDHKSILSSAKIILNSAKLSKTTRYIYKIKLQNKVNGLKCAI